MLGLTDADLLEVGDPCGGGELFLVRRGRVGVSVAPGVKNAESSNI